MVFGCIHPSTSIEESEVYVNVFYDKEVLQFWSTNTTNHDGCYGIA